MPKRDGMFWTSMLASADNHRRTWRQISKRSRHQFLGLPDHSHDAMDFRGGLLFNKMYAAEQNIYALLRPDTVRARLVPQRPDQFDSAKMAQAVINWNIRESDMVDVAADCIVHSRIDGVGIMKVEWGGNFKPTAVADDEGSEVAVPDLNTTGQHTGRGNNDILTALQKVFPDERVGRNLAQEWNIDPWDFLKDEATSNLRLTQWAGHRTWMLRGQLEELQQAGFFERTEIVYDSGALRSTQERWTEAMTLPTSTSSSSTVNPWMIQGAMNEMSSEEQQGMEIVEVWEIHDRANREVVWVVPGTKKVLRREPMDQDAEFLPYVDLRFGAVPWEFWSIPDNYHYIQAQETLDNVMSMLAEHSARFGKAVIAVSTDMPADQKDALKNSTAATLVEIDDPRMVQPIDFGPLPAQLTEMVPLLSQMITEIAGTTQPGTGIPGPSGTTATEVNAIAQQFSARMRRMQLDLQRFIKRGAQRILQLAQQFFKEEDAIPLLGIEAIEWGAQHTGAVSKEMIQGQYSFEMSVGAGAEQADLLEKKQALDLYNLFVNNPVVLPAPLAEMVFRKFGESPDLLINPQFAQQQQAPTGAEGEGEPASADLASGRAGAPDLSSELAEGVTI